MADPFEWIDPFEQAAPSGRLLTVDHLFLANYLGRLAGVPPLRAAFADDMYRLTGCRKVRNLTAVEARRAVVALVPKPIWEKLK